MKAFLSHASIDKGFVNAVAENLRSGVYELDSETFDLGLISSQAIVQALSRSNLFCLFLSKDSIKSAYVEFETLLGVEFLAKAKIQQFLAICLDDDAFSQANANVKFFNVVRKVLTPEAAARLVTGHLISIVSINTRLNHPFVGRENEVIALETQISDPSLPRIRALFISGNAGSGRRTLARKFYEAQFPQVGRVLPQIEVQSFDGLDELHRAVLMELRPSITPSELQSHINAFSLASIEERRRQIAALLNSLGAGREAAFLLDNGGVLTDAGGFNPEVSQIISLLDTAQHPTTIFITQRMIPKRLRRNENDIAYSEARSLSWEAASRLIARLLKDREIVITQEQNSELTKLSDCHPYNIYRLIDDVVDLGPKAFLANPKQFIDWKHRHSSEYLNKIDLDNDQVLILSILKIAPQLDFEAIVSATGLDDSTVSEALQKLNYLHVLDAYNNHFSISLSLRIAVERDTRIRIQENILQDATKSLSASLAIRIEAGMAPLSLINSAVLTTLQSGITPSDYVSAFMLPSHRVWLCKYYYDQGRWGDCIRYGRDALQGSDRLSPNGIVAACRFICLAAARTGKDEIFKEAISILERKASDNWARSNIAYLKGFSLRIQGNLAEAEAFFEEANDLSPGNFSAVRDLAAVVLARGKLSDAERLAREAIVHAPSNPYLLDILIAVLLRMHGKDPKYKAEIDTLFEMLEKSDEESGKSFYSTRKAEYEHLHGSNKFALTLIQSAIDKTPHLFEPRRLMAEIYLKDNNLTKASEVISVMRQMVENKENYERRYNYRAYIVTQSHYLTATCNYKTAKELYSDTTVFTKEEAQKAIKDIEIIEGYRAYHTK